MDNLTELTKDRNFANSEVFVFEMVEGTRLYVSKNERGQLEFNKKNKKPLDKVDRTLTSIYEPFLEKAKDFEFDPDMEFHFILKDEHTQYLIGVASNGNYVDEVDYKRHWANKFDVDYQKPTKLMVNPIVVDMMEKNKYSEFVDVMGISDSSSKGVTILYNDKYYKWYNPNRSNANSAPYTDMVNVIFLELLESFSLFDLINTKMDEKSPDGKYLQLVSNLTCRFIDTRADLMKELSEGYFNFSLSKSFNLNDKFLTNGQVVNYIEKSSLYEFIFRILLGGLRKRRKKASGILNDTSINTLNEWQKAIYKLTDYKN